MKLLSPHASTALGSQSELHEAQSFSAATKDHPEPPWTTPYRPAQLCTTPVAPMAPPTGHDLQLEAECRDVVAVFDVVHAKKRSCNSKYFRVPFSKPYHKKIILLLFQYPFFTWLLIIFLSIIINFYVESQKRLNYIINKIITNIFYHFLFYYHLWSSQYLKL